MTDAFTGLLEVSDGYILGSDYIITTKLLGKGTTAHVYQGWDALKTFKYAIKVISKEFLHANPIFENQFRREMLIRHFLPPHPNVILLHDVLETSSHVYQIFEFFNGKELFEVIEIAPLPERVAWRCIDQLIAAVHHLHRHNIAHRDLKPENVLWDGERVKLIDLGFVKRKSDTQALRTVCGSAHYVSPEFILNPQNYDVMTNDIWALGCVCYAVFTGLLPFHHDNTAQLMKQISTGSCHPLPFNLAKDTRFFVYKLLTVDFNKRVTAEQLMVERKLQPFLQIPTLLAPPYPLDSKIVTDVATITNRKSEDVVIDINADENAESRSIYISILFNKLYRFLFQMYYSRCCCQRLNCM